MRALVIVLVPLLIWAVGVGSLIFIVRGNFKRAASRSYHSQQNSRAKTFSKPRPSVRMSARRPQVEKGLLDMDLTRRKPAEERRNFSSGGSFRNTGFDTFNTKGRKKDLVTGYDRKLKNSNVRMTRAAGMQYSHTYDGHEPWDKCLPKEKDPWDPDFYA